MSRKTSMAIGSQPDAISTVRKYLKGRIMGYEGKFERHEKERSHILELVKRTVQMGESNSALLVGPRGCGKTAMINSILTELSTELNNFKDNVLIVNLHGLVHTNDRLALKDITRQMQLENVVADKVFGTFAENLSFLLECLKSGDKKRSKPIVFILDEFDLFCEHHNQTLLYNLFDIAQSAQAPICVLGVTCRLDVIELLEKRVKSRFSHRQIFLFPGNTADQAQSKSPFEDRLVLFQELLTLPDGKNKVQKEQVCPIDPRFGKEWNQSIDELTKNVTLVNLLKRMYQIDVSERTFRNFLATTVSVLSEEHQKLDVNDFVQASKPFSVDDKLLVLEGLSILEICLIIAMKHETEIYDGEPLNFESIYNRYTKFVNQNSCIQSVQRPVIMKAFEHIKNLEILVPVTNTKVEKEYQYYKFLLSPQQVTEAVKNYPGLPTEVSQWALTCF